VKQRKNSKIDDSKSNKENYSKGANAKSRNAAGTSRSSSTFSVKSASKKQTGQIVLKKKKSPANPSVTPPSYFDQHP